MCQLLENLYYLCKRVTKRVTKHAAKINKIIQITKLIQKIMETKNGIKFYQMLVTNWHKSSLDVLYTNVFNYATLAEAMNSPFYAGNLNKHTANGESFKDCLTGQIKYQYVLQYVGEDKKATLELRHERIVEVEGGTTVELYQVLIKEIIL